MILQNNKICAALFVITAAIFLTAAGVYCGSRLADPGRKQYFAVFQNQIDFFNPRVTSNTILTKKSIYACKDVEVTAIEPASDDLHGLARKELVEKFSPAGWGVTFHDPNSLLLTRQSDQLCSVHKNYRHLGIYQDRLAVYEGPLGYNERIIRVESIATADLPSELQIKLMQAMDFQKQAGSAIETLRGELEFATEEVLNAALENMDEHGVK